MKKEFIVCYALMAVLVMLCVVDVILGKWLNLVCNAMWVVVEYTVLLSGKRHAEKRRELHEQMLLNSKFCDIMVEYAERCGKVSELFEKVNQARSEAYRESMED